MFGKTNGHFLDLLTYSNTPLDDYDRGRTLRELDYYNKHCNDEVYDIIDYEKLIYFELRFQDDEEIMNKINELKIKIGRNYILRTKLLNRLVMPSKFDIKL